MVGLLKVGSSGPGMPVAFEEPRAQSVGMGVRSIVVTCDAFRVGGRETFLNCYLGELKRHWNTHVTLVAGVVSGKPPSGVFDEIVEAPRVSDGGGYRRSDVADRIAANGRPEYEWNHHYDG